MTPEQHRAEADRLLDLAADARRTASGIAEHLIITAHALLAGADGTSEHYTAAEEALAAANQSRAASFNSDAAIQTHARMAVSHAHLA